MNIFFVLVSSLLVFILFLDLQENIDKLGMYEFFTYMLERTNILKSFDLENEQDYERYLNVGSLVNSVREFEEVNQGATIIDYLQSVTLSSAMDSDDGTGVVIGETAILGDNVTLYQGVTLGGTGKEHGKRHPTLEDNVMVSAGAKILGSFTIGENSKIGAGSVVLGPVPANCTVVGVPGRIVKKDNVRIPRNDLDQVNLPDPVLDAIQELREENRKLREELEILKETLKGGNAE